jgi:tRNA A-37 threonylcarbamoyl transferase component Bud32/Tol biopolymer transport system component
MIGLVLGHYRVLEKIGSGGMGEVYRASDDRLGRDVAIKVLKPYAAHDQDRLRRFEQEARAAAALSHPNIVAIYDIGLHEGSPYIVSELLEGDTLRQRLRDGALPLRQVAEYSSEIARGLVAAHEKGIVHRDLKPENLFVTNDGRIKILDFGIAKLTTIDKVADRSAAAMTTQTRGGLVLGTVAYMSPEQLRGKAVDHRSDIFSFGAIVYEMLTGKRAFSGETDADTMMAVLREEPQPMTQPRGRFPLPCERIVQHCLEKEPEDRFQSARELIFALSTVSDLSTSKPIPAFRGTRLRWKRWTAWAAAAVSLGAAGLVLWGRPQLASPFYTRLTFERGTIYSARFSRDGGTVAYGASWNGRPLQIYSTLADAPLEHPLGVSSAGLLGLSRSNELALVLRGTPGGHLDFVNGMLAREPIAGGAPREVLEDVRWADWSPDGKLAVVHHVPGRVRLEYPIGTVLYETTGAISHIRFSPSGDKLAYMDHPEAWDDRGSVCVIDLAGRRRTLSSGWDSEDGLAWSPQGDEVWFTAVGSGLNRALWAVSLSGHQRQVLGVPGGITLHDIAPDGRVLFTVDSERLAMGWVGKEEQQVQDLSWYDWTETKDISRDGQWVLFEESGEPAGAHYSVGIRKTDGSPPIRLGEGSVGGLSPNGKWAASIFTGAPEHLTLYPVGAGQPREVPLPGLNHLRNGGARFLPDGNRLAVIGNEPGKLVRTYIINLDDNTLRPVTPEGTSAIIASPDGKYLAGANAKNDVVVFLLSGGPARPVPGMDASYVPAQWSADSRALYVYRPGEVPLQIFRVDIATGKKDLLRELVPADRAGVVSIAPVVTTLDASEFAYSYYQTLSVLYVVSALK